MIEQLRGPLSCGVEERFEVVGRELATTDVWRSAATVVKRMRGHEKLKNEVRFYREWAHLWPVRTASLLAECTKPAPAVRISRLAGELVASNTRLQTPIVYRTAAQAVRRLHLAPYEDGDAMSLDDALDARFGAWRPRFVKIATEAVVKSVDGMWSARPPLELATRTRTHRDYSDRNWLWDESAEVPLGVFDFEQSRPDHPWMDLTRLWERDFHGRADLRDAYIEGYGGPSDVLAHPDFRTLAVLHAMATVAWATESGDAEYAQIGANALARVLGLPSRTRASR